MKYAQAHTIARKYVGGPGGWENTPKRMQTLSYYQTAKSTSVTENVILALAYDVLGTWLVKNGLLRHTFKHWN